MSAILRVSLVLLALSSNVLAGPVSARSDILECIKERTGATLTHSQAQAMRAGQMKPPSGVCQQQYNDIFDDCCKSSSTGDSERQGDVPDSAAPASGPVHDGKGPTAPPSVPEGPTAPPSSDPNVEHPNVDADAKEPHAPAGPSTPPQHAPAPPAAPEVNAPSTPPNHAPAPPSAPEVNPNVPAGPSTPQNAPTPPSAPEVNPNAPAGLSTPQNAPAPPSVPEANPDNQRQQRPTAEVNGQEGPKAQDAEVNATGDPNAVAGVPIPGAGAEAKEHTGGEAPPAGAKAMEGSPERKMGVTVPDTIEKAEGAPKTGFRQGEISTCAPTLTPSNIILGPQTAFETISFALFSECFLKTYLMFPPRDLSKTAASSYSTKSRYIIQPALSGALLPLGHFLRFRVP
ncbi:hypothetical protein B0H16DRAFT_1447444 [Mycena metata]|uniref:Uncharacterized protein n=1 Tax=Mycena metata TaxID=1033252 RepID=A0AAD7P0I0_9AGAR|nr:hypothetical protein B0H16DRAFT_1447444 [Mycena metata]